MHGAVYCEAVEMHRHKPPQNIALIIRFMVVGGIINLLFP